MEKPATTADADLILKLYDLRREAQMRKARDWFAFHCWPKNFEELAKLIGDFGAPENACFRQVTSYWEMAASLVLRGALDAGLFLDSSSEMFFVYARLKPFLAEARQKFNPEFMARVEKLAESTPEGRARVERMQEHFKADHWKKFREQASGAGR